MIYCLMNTGKPVDSGVMTKLYNTAIKMSQSKSKRKQFSHDLCEGVVSTKWKHASMGTISGVEFKAEYVDRKGVETTFTFLVESFDLKLDDDEPWVMFNSLKDVELASGLAEAKEHRSRGRLN